MALNIIRCGFCGKILDDCKCESEQVEGQKKNQVICVMDNEQVNWSEFEVKGGEDRIKLEVGKKYELGFCSLKPDHIEVMDKEKTAEGQVEVKKTLAVLVLGVDTLEGKPVKKELMITSKKLVQTIKTYFERDMLFTRVFQLEKSGSGYQTTYQLIALQDKPKDKAKDVVAFM